MDIGQRRIPIFEIVIVDIIHAVEITGVEMIRVALPIRPPLKSQVAAHKNKHPIPEHVGDLRGRADRRPEVADIRQMPGGRPIRVPDVHPRVRRAAIHRDQIVGENSNVPQASLDEMLTDKTRHAHIDVIGHIPRRHRMQPFDLHIIRRPPGRAPIKQVDTIHPEGVFTFEQRQVGIIQADTVPDYKTAVHFSTLLGRQTSPHFRRHCASLGFHPR